MPTKVPMGGLMEAHRHHDLGCWYPVGGVEQLCRRETGGTTTGLCAQHQRRVLHLRWPLIELS